MVRAGLESAADQWLHVVHLPRLGVSVRELDPQQLFMSSVYLIVLGFLLGYMSENQKKVRAERAVITRVLSSTRVEAGLTGTMQQILGEVMSIYGARRVLSASQESEQLPGISGRGEVVAPRAAERCAGARLCRKAKRCICSTRRRTRFTRRAVPTGFHTVLLDRDGVRLRDVSTGFLDALARVEKFDAMVSVALVFGTEWSGRVFLFDPEMMGSRKRNCGFCRNSRSRWVRRSTTCT